jgi:hypothetical protein
MSTSFPEAMILTLPGKVRSRAAGALSSLEQPERT